MPKLEFVHGKQGLIGRPKGGGDLRNRYLSRCLQQRRKSRGGNENGIEECSILTIALACPKDSEKRLTLPSSGTKRKRGHPQYARSLILS